MISKRNKDEVDVELTREANMEPPYHTACLDDVVSKSLSVIRLTDLWRLWEITSTSTPDDWKTAQAD